MSMISELVDKLKKYAAEYNLPPFGIEIEGTPELLLEVADTIESLSAKLAVANMEQSDKYYGSGWILCEDRLPEFGKRYLVTALWKDGELVTYSVYDAVYGSDGIWHTHNYAPVSYKVIAWMPLPEPYRS